MLLKTICATQINCCSINISDINECASNPCVHGTCNDEVNGYNCSCDDGYEGDTCNEGIIE